MSRHFISHTTHQYHFKTLWAAALLLFFLCSTATAGPINITQLSSFINAKELGTKVLEDTQIGLGSNNFSNAGLSVAFTNSLNANNMGSVTWKITNNTGMNLSNVNFFGFLDAEITGQGNDSLNEFGGLVNVSGKGFTDTAADFWEIDTPGEIYNNLLRGILDNDNAIPSSLKGDVSLALGFEVGNLFAGQSLVANFVLSKQNIGGLRHEDQSEQLFYYNGTVKPLSQTVVQVPSPNTMLLLGVGLILLAFRQRKFNR
ncbi:MAG: PEP-CTERM sorting domain-containing protein [Gammaproteobacteria bacterium]|nr:PEP-CTERM sorting domain-containing protein [Gammaproteobacteria bacterium]